MRYAIIGMNVTRAEWAMCAMGRMGLCEEREDREEAKTNWPMYWGRHIFQLLWPQHITPKGLAKVSYRLPTTKVNHVTIRVHTTTSTHRIHFGAPSSCVDPLQVPIKFNYISSQGSFGITSKASSALVWPKTIEVLSPTIRPNSGIEMDKLLLHSRRPKSKYSRRSKISQVNLIGRFTGELEYSKIYRFFHFRWWWIWFSLIPLYCINCVNVKKWSHFNREFLAFWW